MKILFVGKVVPPSTVTQYSGASVAGNAMMWSYLKALHTQGHDLYVISTKPYRLRPFLRSPKVIPSTNDIIEDMKFTYLGYLNLPLIREIGLFLKTRQTLKRMHRSKKFDVIISFNTNHNHASPVLSLKDPSLTRVAIAADPPREYKGVNLHRWLKSSLEIQRFKKFDGLIPITEALARDYAPNVPYLLIEGGYYDSPITAPNPISFEPELKHLVYAGAIDDLSGLDLIIPFLKNYHQMPFKCHLFGRGPMESDLREWILNDDRFIYHGFVPPETMPAIFKASDLLLLPRTSALALTKYTFPSKLIAYMSSGKPVIVHRLEGIPKSYEKYVTMVEETQEAWHQALTDVLKDAQAQALKRAEEGLLFLQSERTWVQHAERLSVFLEDIVNKNLK